MKDRSEIINEAIESLSILTGEDFHGYRSEIWRTISQVMEEQHEITKQLCANACKEESQIGRESVVCKLFAEVCLRV